MKTLEELVKELGLKPTYAESKLKRTGNFAYIFSDNTYITSHDTNTGWSNPIKIIEVKPE